MKNVRSLLVASSLVAGLSGLASATTIIQTFSLPMGSTNTSWTQSSTINTFNTNLGTLEDIKVTGILSDTENAGATDVTGNTCCDTYAISAMTNLNLTDPTGDLLIAPSNSVGTTFGNMSNGQTMGISAAKTSTGKATWIVDPSNPLDSVCSNPGPGCLFSSNTPGTADPINYAAFESAGGGSINLTGNASSSGSFGGGSFGGAFATGTASVLVTIVYDYNPAVVSSTPEPVTMLLFGSGLVAVGLIRKKLKS